VTTFDISLLVVLGIGALLIVIGLAAIASKLEEICNILTGWINRDGLPESLYPGIARSANESEKGSTSAEVGSA
jgi:hypothetical protein